MKKILVVIIVLLIIFGIGITIDSFKEDKIEESNLYQGPVPEGYDEDYFRLTGETIPIE